MVKAEITPKPLLERISDSIRQRVLCSKCGGVGEVDYREAVTGCDRCGSTGFDPDVVFGMDESSLSALVEAFAKKAADGGFYAGLTWRSGVAWGRDMRPVIIEAALPALTGE